MNDTIHDTPAEDRSTSRALVPVDPAVASDAPVEQASAPVPVVRVPGPPDTNPAMVYLAAKASAAGRRGLVRSLGRAAEILTGGLRLQRLVVDWREVGYQHVAALRAVLLEQAAANPPTIKPATINHTLAAVRGTMREAFNLGQIDADTLARINGVKNVKATRLPAGRHLEAGEIIRLFDACGDTPVGARDAAMLALLYGCGLRRSEAVAVQLADYDAGAVTIRHGKGDKERVVYCQPAGQAAVDAWIARRGSWPGALLCPLVKGGHVEQRAMTPQAVLMRLRFLAKRAKVKQFSPHDLRRTFVGAMLAAGADISSVQQLAGHAAVSTTARYDRRPEDDAKRKAAALLPLPYSRRRSCRWRTSPRRRRTRNPRPTHQVEATAASEPGERGTRGRRARPRPVRYHRRLRLDPSPYAGWPTGRRRPMVSLSTAVAF